MKKHVWWLNYCVMAVLLSFLAVLAVRNAANLNRQMDEHTMRYVSDVSRELGRNIDYRLDNNQVTLETLVDSVMKMDTFDQKYIYDFLERKTVARGFESVIIAEPDGDVYQSADKIEDVMSLPGIQASFQGEKGVSFLPDRRVLYSVPLELEGKTIAVLGGLKDRESQEELIQPVSFDGKGTTCIINEEGEVVIWSEEMKPLLELSQLFSENPNSELAGNILRMEENMTRKIPGVFRFTTTDGKDMILDYHPLQSFGWILLTLVPSDIISGNVNASMHQTYLLVFLAVLLLGLAMVHMFRSRIHHYKRIQKISLTDPLTGGMNTAAFRIKCGKTIPQERAASYTILMIHIRHFKLINQLFGVQSGDRLLCKVMELLQQYAGKNGFAAHGDADVFYLCLRSGSYEYVKLVFEKINAELEKLAQEYNEPKGVSYPLMLNAGAYIVDDPDKDISAILDCATIAAKEREATEDGTVKFYDWSQMDHLVTEQALNGMLKQALENGEFITYLQPKVNPKNHQISGVEALVRWKHPDKGMISPGEFIPVFEQNGKICDIDIYVFEQVCKSMRCWLDGGHKAIPASVNLSRQHFQNVDFLERYIEIANRYQIPHGMIELELTESIFIEEDSLKNIKNCIRTMHENGFLCSIDDFGAGYSALGLLSEFDIDTVKLDRRFFLNIETGKARTVVKKMVELAKDIGAETVAEGIETDAQLAFVKEIQCDLVQGFYYARPMPIEECEAWMENLKDYCVESA